MNLHYICDNNEMENLLKRNDTYSQVVLDIESKVDNKKSINYQKDTIRLIQTKTIGDSDIFVIDSFYVDKHLTKSYLEKLSKKTIIGHNLNYDLTMLLTNFNHLFVNVHDTMAMAKSLYYPLPLNKGEIEDFDKMKIRLNLQSLCQHVLGIRISKEQQMSNWGLEILSNDQIQYAALDTHYTELLFLSLIEQLEKSTSKRVYEIERRDIHVTAICNAYGIKTDQKVFNQLLVEHEEKSKEHAKVINNTFDCFDLFGEATVNLESSDQVLYNLQRLGFNLKTTKADELEQYAHKHEVFKALIEYQSLQTKISTHIKPYIVLKDENDYVYPNINQFGAITGRKSSGKGDSSTAINIMGMPQEEMFRKGIIAEEGYTLVMADYNALEARIVASISNCIPMINIFNKSKEIQKNPTAYDEYDTKMADVHYVVASELLSKLVVNVKKKEERDVMKHITYLLVYGGSIDKIIKTVAVKSNKILTHEEASMFRKKWFKLFPEIEEWHAKITKIYGKSPERRERNTITTMTGKNLRFDSTKPWIVNEVLNYQVQSVAADGIKLAESEISAYFLSKSWGTLNDKNVRILLQMHDELILQVPNSKVEECKILLKEKMESCMEKVTGNKIAIEAEVKTSNHWLK